MEPFAFLTFCFAFLIRLSVSLFPYSGMGTYPMYGDYEAQRHWQEITVNLRPSEWYENSTLNDLNYWGLDYPPLTAYHSYLNGQIAKLLNPKWVQLHSSRGFESHEHKVFMRFTVLLADLFVFFSAFYMYWMSLNTKSNRTKSIYFACSLFYPGIILIDHGHFQYNCISLGLTVWAVFFLKNERDLLGSVFFCLALNYKHLSLYHAFPFFFYLAGKQFQTCQSKFQAIKQILLIAIVVLATFTILWAPWITSLNHFKQLVNRLFPINRGLFEDKVANIWCTMDLIIKLRLIFTNQVLACLSLVTTCVLLLPSSLHLFFYPTFAVFKYALVNSSLLFFLASFQVHEKQILLPALAVTLVMHKNPLASIWFYFVSTFSLLPLLIKDGQILPYFVLQAFLAVIYFAIQGDLGLFSSKSLLEKLTCLLFVISTTGCLILSIMQISFAPPKRYPDLYTVANSSFSFINFLAFLFYFYYQQIQSTVAPLSKPKSKLN